MSHYTHGLVAGKIASKVKRALLPDQWVDFLTAVVEHDDHLLDFDEENYLTDRGAPMDFTMEKGNHSESLEHAKRVFSNAMEKSQFVALMVGRHLEFLYEDMAEAYSPMKKYLENIGKLRKGQRKLYGLNKGKEDGLYDIMRFADRLSLIICQGQVPATGRKIEINDTIDGKTYFVRSLEGVEEGLTVEPWPFESDSFAIELEYRVVEQLKFKNNEELESKIAGAAVRRRQFKFEQ